MWSNYPPEPVPVDVEPDARPAPPTGPPRPSRLLPVAQCVAEGGLLAVVAAALQAMFGEVPIIGPLEFAILAGAGMGWARRARWRGPAGEAFGLPHPREGPYRVDGTVGGAGGPGGPAAPVSWCIDSRGGESTHALDRSQVSPDGHTQ